MRLALLSDIHGNREALDACLRHARDQGAERLAFLGDLVGYGGDPGYVVDRVAEAVAAGGLAVLGNHDHAALGAGQALDDDDAKETAAWTRQALTAAQRDFLAGLPMTHTVGRTLLVHASAHQPHRWPYVTHTDAAARSLRAAPAAVHTFVGHVHKPQLFYLGVDGKAYGLVPSPGVAIPVPAPRRWLAVVGSVGQPRDRNPAASYTLFDAARGRVTFFRVPYDLAGASARIRAAGLPESNALRLEEGV